MKHAIGTRANSGLREAGFSLLEVMVAIGVAGILTYAVSQFLMNSGRQATSVASKTDFNSFVNEMQGVFNNTQACINAFGGPGGTKFTTTPVELTNLKIGGTVYAAGATFGGPPTMAGQTSKRALKVNHVQLMGRTPTSVQNQFMVPLYFEASRLLGNETSAVGGNNLSHTFNLIVNTTENMSTHEFSIVGCAGQYNDFWASTGTTGQDIIYTGGNVGIGGAIVDPPQARLDVDGPVEGTMFLVRSDARLKENVREIPDALNRVLKLHGVRYDWKNRASMPMGTNQLGLLAQEVERVFPEVVKTAPATGLKSVGYGNLIAPLVEAFKEQQEIISRQQREIAELKKAASKQQ